MFKFIESIFKPVINKLVIRLIQPLATLQQLPNCFVRWFQAQLERILYPREKRIENYVLIRNHYIAKRFLLGLFLFSLTLIYIFVFHTPLAISQRFNLPVTFTSNALPAFSGNKTTIKNQDGSVIYEGTLKNGVYDGNGTLYREDGTLLYRGTFKNGVWEGKGEEFDKAGILLYKGEFVNGKYSGPGALYSRNGNIVAEGEFKNGVLSGAGKTYYENGRIQYEGEFRDGLYHGKGKLLTPSSIPQYEGEFSNGVYSGTGTLYASNGTVAYQGGFLDGRYHADGKKYGPDGSLLYEGKFLHDQMSGFGTWHDKEGVILYKGFFHEDHINPLPFLSLPPAKVEELLGKSDEKKEAQPVPLLPSDQSDQTQGAGAPPNPNESAVPATPSAPAESKKPVTTLPTQPLPTQPKAAPMLAYSALQLTFTIDEATDSENPIISAIKLSNQDAITDLRHYLDAMYRIKSDIPGYVRLQKIREKKTDTSAVYYWNDCKLEFLYKENSNKQELAQLIVTPLS